MNFGLVGNPLGHSLSKIIHNELFKIQRKDYSYELIQSDNLSEIFNDKLRYLDGFNITIPYKVDIINHLDKIDNRVKLYDSCNTVVKRNDKFYGYNTDADGFLASLVKNNISLKNKKVLVLGSGGVSRMFVFESVLAGADVYISSRNIPKCQQIKEEVFKKCQKNVKICENLSNNFDIVLNGTPCGMYPNVLSLPVPFSKITDTPFILDAVYNPAKTLLLSLCEYVGNTAENGLYMLVKQAAEAQKIFCNFQFSHENIQKVSKNIIIHNISIDKNIVLIGPPGSGKTIIGKELSKLLNLSFVDTDNEIERNYGTVNSIFEKYGEEYFRNKENEILTDFSSKTNCLISTGGGAVLNEEIMEKLHNDSKNIVIYLKPNFDIILKRVSRNNRRPLLVGNTCEKLTKMLELRNPLYEKYSNYIVEINEEQNKKNTVINCIDKICGF